MQKGVAVLDGRQRLILWSVGGAGLAAVLLLGLPAPEARPSPAAWWREGALPLLRWQAGTLGQGRLPLEGEITGAALRHGVDPALVAAVVQVESGFRPDALSPQGAHGPMQVMPETAAFLGLSGVADPAANVEAGTRYLAMLLDQFGGDVELALAAYNAGPGAVRRWGGVPPFRETRAFVQRVRAVYLELTGVPLGAAARLLAAGER